MAHVPLLPDSPRPLVFAHRGLSSEAPENTMAAFRLAKEKGAAGVELDIHLTRDGKLVIMHDHTTTRVAADSAYKIEETGFAVLQNLDIGSWKDTRFKNERPPLLSELFEELGDDLYFDVEIKAEDTVHRGLEDALVKLLSDFKYGAERIAVSSFNPVSIQRFKRLCPRVPTAIIYSISDDVPWYLRRGEGRYIAHCDYLKPRHTQVYKAGVGWSKLRGGRPFVPWTIDDPLTVKRMLSIGCEGIISNRPHELGLCGVKK